jgi:hypothetical protein
MIMPYFIIRSVEHCIPTYDPPGFHTRMAITTTTLTTTIVAIILVIVKTPRMLYYCRTYQSKIEKRGRRRIGELCWIELLG